MSDIFAVAAAISLSIIAVAWGFVGAVAFLDWFMHERKMK